MNEQVAKKIDTRVRDKDFVRKPGKTRIDRESGAHQRNASNKSLRAGWDNRGGSPATFPWETCNGKRTRALLKKRTSKRG